MNSHCYICTELLSKSTSADKYSEIVKLYLTPCDHVFHRSCIEDFFKDTKLCPQCSRCTDVKKLLPIYTEPANGIPDAMGALNKLRNENIDLLEEKIKYEQVIADLEIKLKTLDLEYFKMRNESELEKIIAELNAKKALLKMTLDQSPAEKKRKCF